jgi:hypothetical protein
VDAFSEDFLINEHRSQPVSESLISSGPDDHVRIGVNLSSGSRFDIRTLLQSEHRGIAKIA